MRGSPPKKYLSSLENKKINNKTWSILGHIITIDLSPFQSSIPKNIKYNENSL
jgi:hypothetical protein